jgi:hypothetical protein
MARKSAAITQRSGLIHRMRFVDGALTPAYLG